MKKIYIISALLVFLCLCSCGKKPVADKWCGTLAEAEKLIGFTIDAPESVDGSTSKNYHVSGRTLEICYFSGKVLTGRVTKSDSNSDPELYYGYDEGRDMNINGVEYLMCSSDGGNEYYLTRWRDGKNSYLLMVSQGRSADELAEICESIK